MGLDVGVVTIDYLERAVEPVYEFLNALLDEASAGLETEQDDEFVWDASWSGNGLVEFDQAYLERRTTQWAINNSLGDMEQASLADWVTSLPWRDDGIIMLHLSR